MADSVTANKPRKDVFLRLPVDLVQRTDAAAREAGLTRNALVERVLRESFDLPRAA